MLHDIMGNSMKSHDIMRCHMASCDTVWHPAIYCSVTQKCLVMPRFCFRCYFKHSLLMLCDILWHNMTPVTVCDMLWRYLALCDELLGHVRLMLQILRGDLCHECKPFICAQTILVWRVLKQFLVPYGVTDLWHHVTQWRNMTVLNFALEKYDVLDYSVMT